MGQRRKLEGSRMLITGASQGIGRALALSAVDAKVKVLAVARNEALLEELKQEVEAKQGSIEILKADITDPADRQLMVQTAEQKFGGLDILVNNAGIGATGHFADVSPDRLRKIMEVNFFGLTETIRVFLPVLMQGTTPAIVNISSIAGKRGIPARSEYSASKFAVQGFSQALRAELSKDGVDVLLVCPGLTQTNFSQNMLEQKAKMKMDHMRGMTSEQVALATLKSIAKGKDEITLTIKGTMLCMVSKCFPSVADLNVRTTVRTRFRDGSEARQRGELPPTTSEQEKEAQSQSS